MTYIYVPTGSDAAGGLFTSRIHEARVGGLYDTLFGHYLGIQFQLEWTHTTSTICVFMRATWLKSYLFCPVIITTATSRTL